MTQRRLRPDEVELWNKVRQSTTPLHPTRKQAIVAAVEQISQKPVRQPIARFRIGQKAAADKTALAQSTSLPRRVLDMPLNMDSKKYGQLKRGKLVPQARLDLHGMTLEQAHPCLRAFILRAHGDGLRLVLVITGKGRQKPQAGPIPERQGVLRHQVPQWLNSAPLAPVVLQISTSHLRHGGGGALYVYLRRHK
jgi:DNA-nicking Smr family endonuclease